MDMNMIIKKKALDVFRMLFRVKKHTVLFQSFYGKQYSDNPKAISEALHEVAPYIDIAWLFDDCKKEVPDYVRVINYKNIFARYKGFMSASVIVTNGCLQCIKKDKKQMFIQTWHGDRAFKKILHDMKFQGKEGMTTEAVEGYCDLAIAGSEYGVMQYRSGFLYSGNVLCEGTPRDDLLVNLTNDTISKIKRKLKIDEDVKILLYAPTMRNKAVFTQAEQNVQEFDIKQTLNSLEKKYNCKWICFVRAHSAVKKIGGIEYGDKIVDVSNIEDMADLLAISDMLITDYSSCAGDFALLGRPIVLFQSDLEQYLEEDRELYFNIEDSPYYVAVNQVQLDELIYGFEEKKIKNNCKDILKFYKTNETGNASYKVAEIIKEHIEKISYNK